jgi:hypothetical protein
MGVFATWLIPTIMAFAAYFQFDVILLLVLIFIVKQNIALIILKILRPRHL